MLLKTGSYYKTDGGVVVQAIMQHGKMVCRDAQGKKIITIPPDQHVNGWEPTGVSSYVESLPKADRRSHERLAKGKKKARKK